MNDDYLWDRSGHDPEIEAIEDLLAPVAYRGQPVPAARPPVRGGWGAMFAVLATAAAVFFALRWAMPGDAPRVLPSHGVAREIDLGKYGSVTAHADAVLTVVRQSDEEIRLHLERGTIEARITYAARPRLFQVDTPSTTCVDLGCRYTLTVDERGAAVVHVDTGEVAFVDGGREMWVPADATCRAVPFRGSGTPHWDDASPDLVKAVETFDVAAADRLERAKEVARACATAKDALTAWHLLQDPDARIADLAWRVLDNLVGTPDGVTLAATRALDPAAVEAWKVHLRAAWMK